MCNLYSLRKGPQAIIDIAHALESHVGNLAPGDVYPDYAGAIVRHEAEGHVLTTARWGLPSPAFALEGKKTDRGVTNVRNTKSPHWRRWLTPEHRRLVPFTAFAEPGRDADGTSRNVWFELDADEAEPLAFFAGIVVRDWALTRKLKEGPIKTDLYGFLTCEPNAEVGAVHPKAMPVVLRSEKEIEIWMTAPWQTAETLQRPLPDGELRLRSA